MSTYWAVQVYENGKWLGRLTPEGSTTRKTIFAAMIPTREKAEKIAVDITQNSEMPAVTAKAVEF